MRSLFLFPICLLLCPVAGSLSGQTVATFENFGLKAGQHLNNAAPDPGFRSGLVELPNFYDPEFQYWSGWAISADTNTTTPGFTNQYSSIVGQGALGSTTYGITYAYDPIIVRLRGAALGKPMIGMYVTNSTYTYYSMRDGDAFAKKFGGETGNDPDFFRLTIKKYSGGVIDDDSIDVYLADYRLADPSRDYILKDWRYVDLSVLGEADSLVLSLASSDNGIFGMNTPAYFCADEISTDNLLAASALGQTAGEIRLLMNPVGDEIFVEVPAAGRIRLTTLNGQPVWSGEVAAGLQRLSTPGLPSGVYLLHFKGCRPARVVVR